MGTRCPYDVLGVDERATRAEVRSAYRRLALRLHPDTPTGTPDGFAELASAYEVLSSRRRRAEHDRQHREAAARPQAPDLTHVAATIDDLDARWADLIAGEDLDTGWARPTRPRWWSRFTA